MFLGLKVAVCLRGQHAGLALVRYFVDQIEDRGLSICETGRIHKPLVALTLQQSGFVPLSRAAVADILPKSSTQPDHCPRICWVANSLSPEECVSGSNGRKFYRVVTKPEAEINYPLYVPESSRVALHTSYVPSGLL